jgi:pyruvate/2-oxoglutarate dehydrogenase complex dihydrolipoamide dehydrogenase (E3) component
MAAMLQKKPDGDGGMLKSGALGRLMGANAPAVRDDAGSPPREDISADLCVIGAGSGGLSVAAAAAQLGVKVILIEKHKMGGDCLNYGCVPSKALIAAAKRAHQMRTSAAFGIAPVDPAVDWKGVHGHIKSVIAAIAPNDSAERFTGLGVRVIQAAAKFIDKNTVAAGDYRIKARRFVIATGSSPAVPPIPGLAEAPYFTNETIFDNQNPVAHLIVIGGGPIGMELAQAYLRLGAKVTVLEAMKALGKDDTELTEVVLKKLRAEGLVIREGVRVERVDAAPGGGPGGVRVQIGDNGATITLDGSHLLVATGRKANIRDLNLDAAGIKHDNRNIVVDSGLLTSNSSVFAIGDVTGGLQFTHVANAHAGIVIRRALFRQPKKFNPDLVPWVTYTSPELANAGLSEETARKRKIAINVYRWPYHENDRAQAERATDGFIKVITDKKGRILGAAIVGESAGELIQMWSFAIARGHGIAAMTDWISPYPTLSEINKRVAFGYYAGKAQGVAGTIARKAIGWLAKLG